jgi:hypothetical protein
VGVRAAGPVEAGFAPADFDAGALPAVAFCFIVVSSFSGTRRTRKFSGKQQLN